MTKKEWKWFGSAGHCCVGHLCEFHLATQVGEYLISTIGGYRPNGKEYKPLGLNYDDLYETFVFTVGGLCRCGCGLPDAIEEIDSKRYSCVKDAQEGHMKFCEKYDRIENENNCSK